MKAKVGLAHGKGRISYWIFMTPWINPWEGEDKLLDIYDPLD
jgi:hypothetical protein